MWTPISSPPPRFEAARLNAHYAAQLVAAVGSTLAEPQADFSHTSLVWLPEHRVIASVPVGPELVTVGLRISTLELLLITDEGVVATIATAGKTLDAALDELTQVLSKHTKVPNGALVRPDHQLPDHPVASGGTLGADPSALAHLDRWIGNAAFTLEKVRSSCGGSSPVLLWPHHFDMATLITLEGEGESAKTIGVGLSPGDGSYDEPYWYVAPWPYPDASRTDQPLPAGHWHTEGFFAAILTGTALLADGPEGQAQRVDAFLESAIAGSRRLLGADAAPIRCRELVWHKAAELDELPDGRVKSATCGLRNLCITHHKGQYAALTNACPHQGGPLGEGSIENGWLRCPWHGWDFDPLTGKPPGGFDDGVETFAIEARDDGIYVGLEEEAPHVQTASDVIAKTLTSWGVRWTFGMVGHSNLGLADALRRETEAGRMGYIGIRHEGAAAFAVSAYGKLTGRPAACLAIAGPGATNLLTGLWDANVDRAPALALTGQVETQYFGRGAFQEIDLKAAYGKVAQFSATILHDTKFAEIANLACKSAILNRGVSHLIFPDEIQPMPASDHEPGSPEGRMPDLAVAPSQEALAKAVARIKQAKRPAIIVGHGARGSMPAIIAFAEALGLPVLTTFKGKGLIPDDHPLGCGVLGRSGTPIASWFMNEADLLLVFGSSFSNHTGITSYKPIIQVDFEPTAVGRRHSVEVPVFGELGRTMALLTEALAGEKFGDLRTEVAERWKIWRAEKASRRSDDQGRGLNSARVFDVLSRAAPGNAILPVDVGNNTYSFGRYFECKQDQAVLMSGYLGSIGFALPAAMGAWAATQEDDPRFKGRPVISISGDGGLGQYLADFTTLVKYKMNITHILLNNSELGKISKEQRTAHWRVWATSLHNPNFAKFAENCGGLGIRVEDGTQLEDAITKAIAHPGPALVDICTDALLF